MSNNADNMQHDWLEGNDPERSVPAARHEIDEILTRDMDMESKLARLERAAEPLLDAPGHAPMELYQAATAIAREVAWLERFEKPAREVRLRRRVIVTVIRARALHCAGHSKKAFEMMLAAHAVIESAAGGREALLRHLGADQPNVLAECLSRSLGIMAASLRRADQLPAAPRNYWRREIRALADALIPGMDASRALVYPGSPSMVQVLFLLTELRDMRDLGRVTALREFDKRARLPYHRAQSTVPLREVAFAKFLGDDATASEQADLAITNLVDGQFERHLPVVDEQGYLD
jgi:hypothetical protein